MGSDLRMPEVLLQQLRRLRDRLIGVSVADGIGLTLLAVSLNIAFVLTVDFLVDLPVAVRVALLLSVPLTALGMACWKILLPLFRRYRQDELAAVVEVAHPELRERLLSIVEIQDGITRGENGGSELMRSWLLQQTVEFAQDHDFGDAVDARRAVRRCWLGGMAFLALLLPLVFATNAYAVLLARFFDPWGNHERLQNLILTVENPDRVVGRGDDVLIAARPSWRFTAGTLPEAAWMEWTTAAGEVQSRRLDWNPEQQTYAVVLPRIDQGFVYHVSADKSRSRRHQIDVVDRPEITRFTVDVTPPAYTGEPATHHEALLGEVLAIEQSQLDWQLEFNKPVVSAEVLWLDGETRTTAADRDKPAEMVDGIPVRSRTPLPLAEDGQSVSFQRLAALDAPSGRFVVRTTDNYGLTARSELVRRLTVQPDQAPLLEFADNEQHASARPLDVVRIPLRGADDFGLAAVELHYRVMRHGIAEEGLIAVPQTQLETKSLQTELELDLGRLNLSPGMQVSLRARATDHRPVPGPNETWTGTRILQILEDARPYGDQTLADNQHRVDQAMENLKTDLEKQRQAAKQLQAETQADESRQEAWRGDAKTAALEDKLRELAQQMQKLSAVLEQQPIMQPLAEQARELAEQELAQAAAKADDARQAPLPQKQQKLADAAERLQKAQDQLKKLQEQHQTLNQMQRDLLELNRLAENTEQLATQVDDLTRRQPATPAQQAAVPEPLRDLWNQDHQRLVQRHEQLEKDLDRVLAEHPELLEKARENLQHQLASLGEQADQLARQQQALANSTRQAAREQARELGLRDQQNRLLEDEKQLAGALQLPTSEDVQVNGAKETRQAREELEQGNLAESRAQHDAARQQLEQLAQALQQNEQLPRELPARVQALAQKQQAIVDQLAQVPAEATDESRAEMSRLAAEQAALQRAVTELPRIDASRDQQQQTLDRQRDAGRQLAENRQPEAQDQARQALDSLKQLAENLGNAAQQPEQQAALTNDAVQREVGEQQAKSRELQQKAQDLAQRQQALAQQLTAAIPATPADSAMSAAPPSTTAPDPNATPADVGENDSPEMKPATATPGSPPETPTVATALEPATPAATPAQLPDDQQSLARQAKELGEQIRDLNLHDDQTGRMSSEFPNAARAAASELGETNFKRAAELSREAAEKSRQLAEALANRTDGTVPERLQTAAAQASQEQQQLADRLQALAASPEQQSEFRSTRQQTLQQQTQLLASELANRADQLDLKQMDRHSQSETARQGESALQAADEVMRNAIEAAQSGNPGAAAEMNQKSVEALRQAANLTRQASNGGNPNRAPDNRAQGEVGQQVAESAQHLQQAGEQLAQLGQPMREGSSPGAENSQATPEPGGEQAEQGEPGGQPQGDSGAPQPGSAGEGELAQQSPASQSLRDAARNMREAAAQMGLSMNAQSTQGRGPQPGGRTLDQSTGMDSSDTASNGDAHLMELENSLGRVSQRNWGQLPGTLQSELLESAKRQRDPTYGGLIRRYFEEISKARPAELDAPAVK